MTNLILIPKCENDSDLIDSVELMIELAQQNIENGYDVDIDTIFDYAQGVLTLETFNNLVSILNNDISSQEKIPLSRSLH